MSAERVEPLPEDIAYLEAVHAREAQQEAEFTAHFDNSLAERAAAAKKAMGEHLGKHPDAAAELAALKPPSPSHAATENQHAQTHFWTQTDAERLSVATAIAKRHELGLVSPRNSEDVTDLGELYDENFSVDKQEAEFHEGKNQTLGPPYTLALRGPISNTRRGRSFQPTILPLVTVDGFIGGTSVARVRNADDSSTVFVRMTPSIADSVRVSQTGMMSMRLGIDPLSAAMTGSTRDEAGWSSVDVFQRMAFEVRAHLRDASGNFFTTPKSTFTVMDFRTRRDESSWSNVSPNAVPTGLLRLGRVRSGDRIWIEIGTEIVNTFTANDVTTHATNAQSWFLRSVGLSIAN